MPAIKKRKHRLSGVNKAALAAFYRKEVHRLAEDIPNFARFGHRRRVSERRRVRKSLKPQFELAEHLLPGLKRHFRKSKKKNCVQGEDRRVLRLIWTFAEDLIRMLR